MINDGIVLGSIDLYAKMSQRKLVIMAVLCALLSSCKGASITLSPSGMVSVCPGGQILLTCERMSGSILYWDISVPMATKQERIVLSQGSLLSPDFRIGFTEFNISRTSDSPLTSQLLINNVTTKINVYCSDDGNENNSPMTIIESDDTLQSANRILDVSMMNHFLRNSVTVTLQLPREAGAVYRVNVSPLTEFTNNAINDSVVINLTISYNIQYNVSIVSSLCGVTTTKVLNYVTCDHPSTQSLQDRVMIMDTIVEGQFITYTCPSGFILTGPNMSVCMRNREWEPDPGEVDCIADCGHGLPTADRHIKLDYSSTLEGSLLTLTCENEISNTNTTESDAEVLNVTCDSNGRWIPDPADFIESCSPSTTQPPVTTYTETQTGSSALIIGSVLGALALVATTVIIVVSMILCSKKKDCLPRKSVNSCRLPESESIQLENTHHSHYVESLSGQPDPVVVQQDTLVYADIGPSSFKNRGKPKVTLKPVDADDRVEYALLNHRLQKQAITTNQDSIADDSLNLDTLLIQVRGAVTPHWYQLGQALEVSKDVLDKCTNYPPEESIVEVLDQWLRNFPGRPTWRDVANALRSTGVQQLANDIEMVYETGKLPITFDDDDDSQQVFTTTAVELPHQGEEIETESAPPLPPKPPAGSGMPQTTSAPPRPPKFVQNHSLQNWN